MFREVAGSNDAREAHVVDATAMIPNGPLLLLGDAIDDALKDS